MEQPGLSCRCGKPPPFIPVSLLWLSRGRPSTLMVLPRSSGPLSLHAKCNRFFFSDAEDAFTGSSSGSLLCLLWPEEGDLAGTFFFLARLSTVFWFALLSWIIR
ncbi:Neural-cadherin, partial [Araneus ventricosus]